jgi:cobalt-zinc-cadmium resistance protein CzcA
MLNRILHFAITRPAMTLFLVCLAAAVGLWHAPKLPVDAVPDITNVQVMINTSAPGYSPLEVEQRITYPVENAMAGLPRLSQTRSLSRYGLAQVTVIFEEGTDIYFARQLVNERLGRVQSQLPSGIVPELGPTATGLGEIFMFTVDAEPGATHPNGEPITAMDLRTAHDWILRPQLLRVPGVVEVNPIGGYRKEIHIQPRLGALLAHGLSLTDLAEAVSASNQNRGLSFLEHYGEQWLMRIKGQAETLDALKAIPLSSADGVPLRLEEVADVILGKELRTGAATQNGREVVMSTAYMLIGANSRTVAAGLRERLTQAAESLPPGITATPVYDRMKLVNQTLGTVEKNLLEGALLVMAVLFVFLGNLRAAVLTALVIPFTLLISVTGMVRGGVSANLMSLGALDFGLLVDGAVIIVENCLRRLSEGGGVTKNRGERLALVADATQEVIRPALFGVLIITVVYVPIFALSGVEGKMFHPMALTVVLALLVAMVLAVTLVPAGIALFFTGAMKERPNPLLSFLAKGYDRTLGLALRHHRIVLGLALVAVGLSAWQSTRLGSEFVPQLDEGDIAMHALRIPGTSLSQAIALQSALEERLAAEPEVERVFAKMGTAEVATDPVPPSVADNFIILKPREAWPDPKLPKAALIERLQAVVAPVPGNRYEFLQPIQMRFNELIAGVRAELAVKIYGDDLDTLARLGQEAAKIIGTVDGAADTAAEQSTGLPVLTFTPRYDALARYGVPLKALQDALELALAGKAVSQFYEGDRRFSIVLRMPEALRGNPDALATLPLHLGVGSPIPLGELVTFETQEGLNQVNREDGKRRVVVTANVRGRDLGSFVAEVKETLGAQLTLPTGYWLAYGGAYENLASAQLRLAFVVPLTLILIFAVLTGALSSAKDALVIYTGIPLALTGGVLALTLRGIPFSISAAVGFIALSGIAVLNGLVMVSFIRDLRLHGMALNEAVQAGATARLRPVLMTALVASLGFVPMAFNTGIGSEVQRPLATVVIGGVLSSTLLTLVVLPLLYRLAHGRGRPLAGAS